MSHHVFLVILTLLFVVWITLAGCSIGAKPFGKFEQGVTTAGGESCLQKQISAHPACASSQRFLASVLNVNANWFFSSAACGIVSRSTQCAAS